MSRAISRRCCRLSGTSPETIRWASPSTIAVLPDARLADQDRVVLGPPAQDLDDATDLRIAADDRVDLSLTRQLDQVAAVALQRLVLVLGVLIGHPLAAADLLQRLEHLLFGDPQGAEQGLRPALDLHQSQQEVLDRDVLVLESLGFGRGGIEHLVQLGAEGLLAATDLGQRIESFLGGLEDLGRIDAQLAEERTDHLLVGVQQGRQQVHRLQSLMPALAGQRLGLLHRLLALQGELVESESHDDTQGD